jgi:hypothetical protein
MRKMIVSSKKYGRISKAKPTCFPPVACRLKTRQGWKYWKKSGALSRGKNKMLCNMTKEDIEMLALIAAVNFLCSLAGRIF